MAKRVTNSVGGESLEPLSPLRPAPPRTARKWSLAMAITALAVAICASVANLVLPEKLPLIWQRLTGLACAVLSVFAFVVATRQTESPEEEMLLRIRRGQHADFGKRLREAQQVRTTVKLPFLGETSIRGLVAVAVFLVVAGWWLTPVAPVGVKEPGIADMTVPFAEEIVAVVLIMPDGNAALAQPPIPPVSTRRTAMLIDDDKANAYQRGLKAIALNRFKQARGLLAEAMASNDAPPYDIRVARAQTEMYAGRFRDAVPWYRDALRENPDDPMLLCQMAVAWIQAGEFKKAEPFDVRAMEVCRAGRRESGTRSQESGVRSRESGAGSREDADPRRLTPDPWALGVCLHVRAVLNVGLGKQYDQAVKMCRQSREIFKENLTRPHPFEAASLNNQATLYLLQANYQGGQGLYRRAGDIWTKSLGPYHPNVAASVGNLAMLYYKLGQYTTVETSFGAEDAAEELFERALAVRGNSLPDAHPILGMSCSASALLHVALAEYEAAQPLAERALAVCSRQNAADSTQNAGSTSQLPTAYCLPPAAAALDTLAAVYVGQARYTKAELYYLRAVTVAEEVWGSNHPTLAAIFNHLADLYIVQERYEEAEEFCERALEILETSFGRRHPAVAAALYTRGRLEIARGHPRNARKFLEEAQTIREDLFGKEHPDVARTIAELAVLDALSPLSYARGVRRYRRAIEILRRRLGAEHPDVAHLWQGLAALFVRQRNYSDAENCLKQALQIQENSLVPFHPDLAATLEAYAALLSRTSGTDSQRAADMEARARSIRAAHAEEDRPESGEGQL